LLTPPYADAGDTPDKETGYFYRTCSFLRCARYTSSDCSVLMDSWSASQKESPVVVFGLAVCVGQLVRTYQIKAS
jgi:hypothetical protein